MGDLELKRVLAKMYEGTIESAAEIVEDLKLEDHQYFLDVRTGCIYIHTIGLRLNRGDYVHIPLPPEKFQAIG